MKARRVPAGLTLIEVLVAIGILALVAVLGWRGLDGIVRARIALNADLEQTRGMQLAFAQLQSDCAQVANPTLLPNRAPLVAESGRLMLVRTVFSDTRAPQLVVVTYRLRDGVLTRQESPATRDLAELDTLWLAAAAGADTGQQVALQKDVASMTMRLWDGSAWRPTENGALPPVQSGAGPAAAAAPPALTGLEVALQLRGREAGMLKIFLLGAI